MSAASRRSTRPALGAVLLAALLATGCAGDPADPSASIPPTKPSAPSSSAAERPATPSAPDSTTPDSTAPSATTPARPGASGREYVALGDSFASGIGIGATTGGSCARSERNFAHLVATAHPDLDLTDVTCAGATTFDYTHPQGSAPPQFDALTEQTRLVTLGPMGGNDINLVTRAAVCISGECAAPLAAAREQAIADVRPRIRESIAEAKRRAPRARILVVGYGTYLPKGTCDNLPGFTRAEARTLQGVIDDLSDTIKDQAAAESVEFIDPRRAPGAAQHTVCAPPEEQWIRGLTTYGDGALMHPSSAGHAAVAAQITAALDG